jgi:SAM-dependent methyltransferase
MPIWSIFQEAHYRECRMNSKVLSLWRARLGSSRGISDTLLQENRRNLLMRDPTERFSDRVDNYAKYRPSYPDEMFRLLQTLVAPPATVADIGSGTGILTRQLLNNGYELYAVEPNEAMRREAERTLSGRPAFRSVAGTAEVTTLADRSVDLITCAQSFHWFDRVKTRLEFYRILKVNGMAALIWNERLDDASEVNREYDDLLRRMCPDYQNVSHRQIGLEEIRTFFAPGEVQLWTFPNDQVLDREGFFGRLLSSSYVPNTGQPGNREIIDSAGKIFDAYNVGGRITFNHETKLYVATLPTPSAPDPLPLPYCRSVD